MNNKLTVIHWIKDTDSHTQSAENRKYSKLTVDSADYKAQCVV